MNNTQPQINNYHKTQTDHEDYTLFLVFQLPDASEVASYNGKLITPPEEFLLQCIDSARERNFDNLKEGTQHSKDYFTNLNHAERHRIPSTLHRLNTNMAPERYGIISFSVYKDEQVKNKVYNQRISSVNPQVIELERIKQIYYPLNYQTEQFIDLYPLGKIETIDQEDFSIVNISEQVIQRARELI